MGKSQKMNSLDTPGNDVEIDDTVKVTGHIRGEGNTVRIAGTKLPSEIHLLISGNNNVVTIGENNRAKRLTIVIGSHVQASGCIAHIGRNFSSEPACEFYLYNSGNRLKIGEDCMFSRNIVLRCGDSPHLLFDKETGAYLDTEGSVQIGDHVWVGEFAYITKKVTLPNDTIVAAKSVVTRRFTEEYSVVAGNPAKIVRQGVKWARNHGCLEKGTPEHESYFAFQRSHQPT